MGNKLHMGVGWDIHPLVPGRKLVLGGEEVPFERGLEGWSDADVLTHAVMDALLGAAALGDIGKQFPPGDDRYEAISSLVLLYEVIQKLAAGNWRVVNIDATVIAEKPRLSDYIEAMRANLANIVGIKIESVSVKASTSNGIGSIGSSEGIAAVAVALIEGGHDEDI